MTTHRQGFGPDGRPLCFNRDAMPAEVYVNDGYTDDGRLQRKLIPYAFSRGCKSWVADPSTDPVPLAEGWKCGGCSHFPSEAVDLALRRQFDRRKRALNERASSSDC